MLLVSAGGRAQLKVWHLSINNEQNKNGKQNLSISYREVAEHLLKGNDKIRKKKSWKTSDLVIEDTETRYMDVDVYQNIFDRNSENYNGLNHTGQECNREQTVGILIATACSDGVIRLMSVSSNSNTNQRKTKNEYNTSFSSTWYKNPLNVLLEAQTEIHSHSFLRIKFIKSHKIDKWDNKEEIKMLATSTDGKLYRIRYSPKSQFICHEEPVSLYVEEIVALHQSGINGIWVHHNKLNINNQHDIFVVTGGDDGSIAAAKLDCNLRLLASTSSSSKQNTPMHSAPVTGICRVYSNVLNELRDEEKEATDVITIRFASCSVDQRVCIWKVEEKNTKTISPETPFSDENLTTRALKIHKVSQRLSNVPDIQAIVSLNLSILENNNVKLVPDKMQCDSNIDNSENILAVAGVGIEVLGVN